MKKINSILNDVYLHNGVIYKQSKPIFSKFLNIESILQVQNFLKKMKFDNLLQNSYIKDKHLYTACKYLQNNNKKAIFLNELKFIIIELKKLHALNIKNECDLPKWIFFPPVFEMHNYAIYKWLQNFKQKYKHLPKCLCHNDLHLLNILFTKKQAFLIDWDFAGINSPYFDYASLIYENNWRQDQYFNYLIEALNLDKQILIEWVFYNCVFWLFWNHYMHKLTNDKLFITYAKQASKNLQYWKQFI